MADGHRRLGRPVVLGVRTGSRRTPCGRRDSSGGRGSRRLHDVPRRDLGCPARLGRDGLPWPRLLQRGRQGRPLRRLGGAEAVRGRAARGPLLAPVRKGVHMKATRIVRGAAVQMSRSDRSKGLADSGRDVTLGRASVAPPRPARCDASLRARRHLRQERPEPLRHRGVRENSIAQRRIRQFGQHRRLHRGHDLAGLGSDHREADDAIVTSTD